MIKQKYARFKLWLADQFEKRPMETIAGSLAVLTGMVKLIDAVAKFINALTWKREVKRREKLHK